MFDVVNALTAALALATVSQAPAVPPRADTPRLSAAVAAAREANPMLRAARLKADAAVMAQRLQLPPGYTLTWSGQYEFMPRVTQSLRVVVPVTLGIIFLLLYLNFRGVTESLIVMLALPFSLVGGIWFLWALGYNTSVAVWVGFIALAGVAAETGVVMLIYLDEAFHRRSLEGRMHTRDDVAAAVHEGALERLRPVMMTVTAIIAGLAPILWSAGTGADVMKRIASPMVGGMVTATLLTLLLSSIVTAAAMSYSSLSVAANALRLRWVAV